MSNAPAYSKIGSKSDDLLGSDAFDVGTLGFEVKTKKNNVTFTTSGSQKNFIGGDEEKDKAAVVGSLTAKYQDKPRGLSYTETWALDGKLSGKVTFEPAQVKGLTLSVAGDYKESGDKVKKTAKVGLDFANEHVNASATFAADPDYKPAAKGAKPAKGGNEVSLAVGAKANNVVVGVKGGYNLPNAKVTPVGVRVGYVEADTAATFAVDNLLDAGKLKVGVAYFHSLNASLQFAGAATMERQSNDAGAAEPTKYTVSSAFEHALDDANTFAGLVEVSTQKSGETRAAVFGLEYTSKLSKDVEIRTTARVDSAALLANTPAVRVGFKISYGV